MRHDQKAQKALEAADEEYERGSLDSATLYALAAIAEALLSVNSAIEELRDMIDNNIGNFGRGA